MSKKLTAEWQQKRQRLRHLNIWLAFDIEANIDLAKASKNHLLMSASGKKSENVEKNFSKKLELRKRRTFSESFKQQKVKELADKLISIDELSKLYDVSRTSIYGWIYKYSPHHQQGTTQVVQMESEAQKTKHLQERVAELERIVGQKQIEIFFLNQLLQVVSTELKVDLKKTFCT